MLSQCPDHHQRTASYGLEIHTSDEVTARSDNQLLGGKSGNIIHYQGCQRNTCLFATVCQGSIRIWAGWQSTAGEKG